MTRVDVEGNLVDGLRYVRDPGAKASPKCDGNVNQFLIGIPRPLKEDFCEEESNAFGQNQAFIKYFQLEDVLYRKDQIIF
jgi:hypothetical protein